MNTQPESPYYIDGTQSWLHCLELSVPVRNTAADDLIHHYHNYIEILYALDTDALLWLNGISHPFQTGDFAIINSMEPHTLTILQPSRYICIKFSPQILYADENALFEFRYMQPFLRQDAHRSLFCCNEIQDTELPKLAQEIMREWNDRNTAYELAIRSDILKMFSIILRRLNLNAQGLAQKQHMTDAMKKALSFISDHFLTINEQDVAEHCGLSYHHFSYAFKQLMGINFNEYLNMLKLKEAEKLLLTTDHSITDIAFEAGFSTVSHFIARFKAAKGITPHKLRKKLRT